MVLYTVCEIRKFPPGNLFFVSTEGSLHAGARIFIRSQTQGPQNNPKFR